MIGSKLGVTPAPPGRFFLLTKLGVDVALNVLELPLDRGLVTDEHQASLVFRRRSPGAASGPNVMPARMMRCLCREGCLSACSWDGSQGLRVGVTEPCHPGRNGAPHWPQNLIAAGLSARPECTSNRASKGKAPG